ncbi:hypothetical protein [Breoghania sp.]|uniref:calcium-binding protein n=1 Tax=Breoghania sp. TaxID=2065378 RepID=UPI00262CB51B|nr:hypothetical protein [Breoghania sp.]MDJ0929817.1 hypothetical protein [Breoghania sp.]
MAHNAIFIDIEDLILNASDTSAPSVGANVIKASSADNRIVESGWADIISGLAGDDVILGNDGDDIIDGGAGADTLDGGDGNDTLRLSVGGSSSEIHTVNLATNMVSGGELDGDTISGFENVTAAHNSRADFTGDPNDNVLMGSNYDDVLCGEGGNDTFIGDTGYNGTSNADTLIGGTGDDTLKGGSDTLYGNDTDLSVEANLLAQDGENDVAVFDGTASDYNITREADGSWRVEDTSAGHTDALYGIEGIDFGGDGVDLDLTTKCLSSMPRTILSGPTRRSRTVSMRLPTATASR